MSEKRRDNRNRILQTGENQRKDDRYVYKYNDNFGQTKFVYAWRLVPTDKTPSGKREDLSLREKEKEIQRDLDDGIDTAGKKMTVCELYAMQIRHNGNVKPATAKGRNTLMNIIKEDKIGGCAVENVKPADAKEWVLRMKENGYAFKTIKNYKRSLSAAFHTAVVNDFICKNPFEFDITDVIEDDTERKEALTPEQERLLLDFVYNSFTRKDGVPHNNLDYVSVFGRAREKFAKIYDMQLPKSLSAHTMRHTFCTGMANAGMNPKSLQYFMGHANITMTLNYYAHDTYESARDEFTRINAEQTEVKAGKSVIKPLSA